MYKVFKDDSTGPEPEEILKLLNQLTPGDAFDLPKRDNQRVRYAMGKIMKQGTKRFSCFLLPDKKTYRCKRVKSI